MYRINADGKNGYADGRRRTVLPRSGLKISELYAKFLHNLNIILHKIKTIKGFLRAGVNLVLLFDVIRVYYNAVAQYSSQAFRSGGGGKISPKGTSMKFLVAAFVAQTGVAAGSKGFWAGRNGIRKSTQLSRRPMRVGETTA